MFKYIFITFLMLSSAHAFGMSCVTSLEGKNINDLAQSLSLDFNIPERYQGKTLRIKNHRFNIRLTSEGFQVKQKLLKKPLEIQDLNKKEYLELKIEILNKLLKKISKSPLRLFGPRNFVLDTFRPHKAYKDKTELGLQAYDEIMSLKQELDYPIPPEHSKPRKILGSVSATIANLIGLPTLFSSKLTTDSKYFHTRKYFKVKTGIQIVQRMMLRASIGLAIFVVSSNINQLQNMFDQQTQPLNEILQNPEFIQTIKDLSENNFHRTLDEKQSEAMVLLKTYKSFIESAPSKDSEYYSEYLSIATELREELTAHKIDPGLIPNY